jgi:hypothetical protein
MGCALRAGLICGLPMAGITLQLRGHGGETPAVKLASGIAMGAGLAIAAVSSAIFHFRQTRVERKREDW